MRSLSAWIRSRGARAQEPASAYPTLYLRRLEDRRVLNGEPVANPDSFDAAEDVALSIPASGVLANDTTSGGALTATKVTDPAHGVLTLNPDGSFDYTPNADFFGTDSFTYLVNDGALDSLAPATVTITVAEVNDAPDAVDDAGFDATEDTPLTIDPALLLGNDSAGPNEGGQTLSVTSVSATSAQGGTVAIVSGEVVYTPPPGFSGTDSFTYTISDDGTTNGQPDALTDFATVEVQVAEVNDPPTADPDSVSTAEDTPLTFAVGDLLVNDSPGPAEEAGQNLSVVGVSATSAQGGTVALVAGQITYTPPPDFVGTDTFNYTLQDDGTTNGSPDPQQAQGTVTVTVTEVNDDPVTAEDPYTVAEESDLTFAGADLLLNDSPGPANESGQTLAVIGVDATSANGGTLTFIGGVVVYTPPPDFVGEDTFVYTIRDNGTTNGVPDAKTTTGLVRVTVTEVNDEPVAGPDNASTDEDTPLELAVGDLLANDAAGPANEAGQTIEITDVSVTSLHGGTVSLTAGVVTYTPPPDFNGTDSFTYTLTDNGTTGGQPDPRQTTGTVTITVTPVNDPPVAGDDNVTATEDEPLVFDADDLLANDSAGPADEPTALEVVSVSGITTAGGTVSLVNGEITYTPAPNFNGPDSFTYTVRDSDGLTAQGTVFVTVQAVNDPPEVVDDLGLSTDEDVPLNGTVLGNDTDIDADPLLNLAPGAINTIDPATIVVTEGPDHGQVVFASDGSFVYTPTFGYSGTDEFSYTVRDTEGAVSNVAVVQITINRVADQPDLAPPTLPTNIPEGTLYQFTLSGSLNDPDGSETLVFELDDWPASWTISSPNATIAPIIGGYRIIPNGGATSATIEVHARDNADQTVKIRAVAIEAGPPGEQATREITPPLEVFNVDPVIQVGDAQVTAEGTVLVRVIVFDPGADQVSFQIDWQDGTTYDSGVFLGGQTKVFDIEHQYFVTPPSVSGSGQIVIEGVTADDDGGAGADVGILTVPGTGISAIRIDTTPQAPPPPAPPRVIPEAPSTDRAIPVVNTRPADTGGARGEATQTSEPSLSLRVVSPDGEEGENIDVALDTLRDLPTFFRKLPDGHYRLYLTERGGGQRRLVLDVFVRRGQPIDPEDLSSEGGATPDGAAAPGAAEAERAAQLERYWELRGAGERDWPPALDRAADVDARMARFALQGR